MKSQICDLLGIEFPMVAFSHCRDVVAAVSKAGGMGVLGAVGLSPEKLEIELNWIDPRTDASKLCSWLVAFQGARWRAGCRADAEADADGKVDETKLTKGAAR